MITGYSGEGRIDSFISTLNCDGHVPARGPQLHPGRRSGGRGASMKLLAGAASLGGHRTHFTVQAGATGAGTTRRGNFAGFAANALLGGMRRAGRGRGRGCGASAGSSIIYQRDEKCGISCLHRYHETTISSRSAAHSPPL